MRNLIVLISVLTGIVFSHSSCSRCNKANTAVTVVEDSSAIPGLAAINAELSADSLNAMLYFKRAKLYDANQDYKSAVTDMFIALTLDSLRPEFYLYAADLFKKTAEPQRGVALMNKAISTDSLNIDYYIKAAELAFIDTTIKNNYQLAINYLNEAIVFDMQRAEIYFYKGMIYKEIGDTEKAMSSFQTATELNPQYYEAYVQLGFLSQKRNDKNAEKYFDNAIRVGGNPEDALYAKANMLKEEGVKLYDKGKTEAAEIKLSAAIESFKKVIELNYRNVEAYMGIGFSYYQMDSVEQAYEYYDKATKVAPAYAGAYFSKGLCAEDLGRTREAIMLYQNCLNIDPDFERAKQHLQQLQKTP